MPPGGPEPTRTTRGTVLLEREGELAVLDEVLRSAAGGVGRLVLVEGPAGIGKSGLLDAAVGTARAASMPVLRGRGAELEQALPFGLARQLLVPALVELTPVERADVQDGPARGAEAVLAEHPADDGGTGAPADLAARIDTLFWMLHALARRAPSGVLIAVDDLQWSDAATVRLLVRLAVALDELPVAVVITVRTGEPVPAALLSRLRATPGARRLDPAPLSPEAVGVVVRSSLDPDAAPEVCAACASATGGNPFLVTELVAHLRDEGVPATAASAPRLAAMVPDSVLRSVLVRLSRLPDAARDLARAAATLGPDAPRRLGAAVADLDDETADEAAQALISAGLLLSADPLRLAHPLLAAAITADMSGPDRSRAHRRAAELLAGDGAADGRVAAHLRHTLPRGDPWVVHVLRSGGADAMARDEAAGAVALLERALDEPPAPVERPGLLVELAYAEAANGSPRALEHLEESRRSTDDPRELAVTLQAMSRLLFARGEPTAAVRAAEQGRALLDPDDPLAGRILASQLANMFFVPWRWDETVQLLDELEDGLRSGRWPRERLLLAQLATRRGVWGCEPAHRTAEVAEEILATPTVVGEVWQGDPSLAAALIFVDEFALADRVLDRMDDHARRTRSPISAGMARHWRSETLLRQGRIAEAVEFGRRSLAIGAMGWTSELGWSSAVVARASMERGDLDGARDALRAGQDVDPGLLPHGFWLLARAELALVDGDGEAALADALAAGALLRDRYALDNPAVVPWRSVAARSHLALGDTRGAAALAEEELALARPGGIPTGVGVALRTVAACAGPAEAVTALEEAVAVLEPAGTRLEHARAVGDLGVALRRAGRHAAARDRLDEALRLARGIGATATARRAHLERRRAGARSPRSARDGDALTPAEARVAELAARDHSNAEIAEMLVITPRTVEWHLTQTYRKLGIRSRAGLRGALDRLADSG